MDSVSVGLGAGHLLSGVLQTRRAQSRAVLSPSFEKARSFDTFLMESSNTVGLVTKGPREALAAIADQMRSLETVSQVDTPIWTLYGQSLAGVSMQS